MSYRDQYLRTLRSAARSLRHRTGRTYALASRFYRFGRYAFSLIIWSRITLGRSGLISLKLPEETLAKKGIDQLPPSLSPEPDNREAAPFQRGFTVVYSLLFANLHQPDALSRLRYAVPGPAFLGVYLWDSAFIAQIWKHWDTQVASEVLRSVIELREGDRLQHVVSEFVTSRYTQPPLIAWSAVKLAETMKDRERTAFFSQIYEPLTRYNDWLYNHRRLPNGLFYWENSYESGVENSPRFGNRAESDLRDTRMSCAPDFATYVILQNEALARMADTLGKAMDHDQFSEKADRLRKAVREQLYCEEDGVFYDRDLESDTFIRNCSIASILPLWAGIPGREQAAKIKDMLMREDTFNTPIPLPSVSRSDPEFEKDMWRGPVWINTAYGVIQGLLRYGYEREAGALAYKLCRGVYTVFERENQVYEFYDPEDFSTHALNRKKGNLWKAFTLGSGPQKDFVGWSGLVNTLFIEVLLGFTLNEERPQIRPRFPSEMAGMRFTLRRLHSLPELRIRLVDDGLLHIGIAGNPTSTLRVNAFETTLLDNFPSTKRS